MDNNKSGQIPLPGTNQRYNNVNRGKVDKGRIKIGSADGTGTKVIPNCGTS
jgi:hypothetical protein